MAKHDAIEWNETLEDSVLDAIENGSSLRQVAKQHNFSESAIIRRKHESESFETRYTRAKQIQIERMAEDLVELADQADKDTFNAQRLKVDTRKWLLSKLIPKTYGDKLEHTGADGQPLQLIISVPVPKRDPEPPALPVIDQKLLDK